MLDLYLDPTTHDLVLENFTFSRTQDKSDLIIQKLKIKLLWFKEEWFLDRNYGIPYFQQIFIKGIDLNEIDDTFRDAIANEQGVLDLIAYSSEFNPSTRKLTVNSKVRVDSGEIINISFTV